jgi:tyrosinase
MHRYWDWAADSGAPASADVWDPTTGFGGNGNQTTPSVFGTVCVLDGPFTVLNPVYWNNGVRPHCLQRSFAETTGDPPVEMFGFNYTPDIVAQVSSETVYDRFNNQLENGPHAAVHQGVAGGFRGLGDLGPASSPNGQSIQLASLVGPH